LAGESIGISIVTSENFGANGDGGIEGSLNTVK